MADLVAEFPQFRGELAQAFAGPAQRRHRLAARRRFDQRIEVIKKLRVYLNKRLATAARASNATFFERCRQVLQAPPDRTRRTSRNTRDGGNPAIARGLRFARRKKTPASFVEMRRQARVALSHRIFINHLATIRAFPPNRNPLPSPNRHQTTARFICFLTSPKRYGRSRSLLK